MLHHCYPCGMLNGDLAYLAMVMTCNSCQVDQAQYASCLAHCLHTVSGRSKSTKWRCCICRCMLDYEPRKLTAQDCTVLCNLAGMVIKQIQRDQLLLDKENSGQDLQRRNSRLNVGNLYSHTLSWTIVVCDVCACSAAVHSPSSVHVRVLLWRLSHCIKTYHQCCFAC